MLFILLVIIAMLCGCSSSNITESENTVSVIMPDKSTALTVNGYYMDSSGNNNIIKYYANVNSKKFHLESCRWATDTKAENIIITSDRSRLLSENYIPCKTCKP